MSTAVASSEMSTPSSTSLFLNLGALCVLVDELGAQRRDVALLAVGHLHRDEQLAAVVTDQVGHRDDERSAIAAALVAVNFGDLRRPGTPA